MLETVAQRNALLTSIERARGSSVIAYMLHDNAMIADDALPQLYDKLYSLGKRDRIDLLLYARGGITEVCWRILNLVREYCDHMGVIVGTRLQGAGALLALGADEILLGPLSELGGVEAIRKHPLMPRDEMGQPLPITLSEIDSLLAYLSGGAGRTISDKGRKPGETDRLTAGPAPVPSPEMLSTLFQHINPLVLANLQQADALARDVTRKALYMHMGADDEETVERLVDLFNGGFHSPIYTPSRAELHDAGLPVTMMNQELWSQVWSLVQLYHATLYNDRPDQSSPGSFYRYVCLIETMGRTTGLRQVFTHVDGQERPVQMGWETAVKGPGPGPSFGPGGMSNN
ncbi:MAG: hypothetical protein ABI670_17060 [Chloroflexota bacterium]